MSVSKQNSLAPMKDKNSLQENHFGNNLYRYKSFIFIYFKEKRGVEMNKKAQANIIDFIKANWPIILITLLILFLILRAK